jgi:2-polyprenyl-3-methyl-5-hydroxy-6-metoxy-1,4-benzoquinol methylase
VTGVNYYLLGLQTKTQNLSGGTDVDTWKFFAITHADHIVCNPTSIGKLDELIALLDLLPGLRILDVGCGKGELLLRELDI